MTINVGIIGMGFMGRTHAAGYQAAAASGLPCRLSALCDHSLERLGTAASVPGNLGGPVLGLDPGQFRSYTEPLDLIADPGIHLVSICTYTDTHAALAEAALLAGKHVLIEKPVALSSAGVRHLADVARQSGRLCMPGMCMRFWPGWDWLHDRILDGSMGAIRGIALTRMGAGPGWAAEFYRDESRSGGVLFDLHVHDVDFLYWCFGRPRSVYCAGSGEHFTTSLQFDGGPAHATAEGAWDLTPAAGFRMRFVATFERATVEWHLSRSPALVVHWIDRSEPVPLPAGAGYEPQIAHLVRAIAEGRADLRATLDDAAVVTEVLEAISRSRASARPVAVYA